MRDIENLKAKMINTGFFFDCNALDKYCELIASNVCTKKEKFKTQCHHILPKTYFNEIDMEIDNSSENLVNLYFSDHVLAHYYLTLCVKESRLKYKLLYAFRFIYGKNKKLDNSLEQLDTLIDFQKIYEETKYNTALYRTGCKNKPMSEQGKKNISEAHKGLTPVNKGKAMSKKQRELLSKVWSGKPKSEAWKNSRRHKREPHTEEHKAKISNSLLGHKVSDETKQKISTVNKGKKWMTNGEKTIFVPEESVNEFLEKGFIYGRKYNKL